MNSQNIKNFIVLNSIHGKFIVNRHDTCQPKSLQETGKTHIEAELEKIYTILDTLPENCVVIDGGANAGFFTIPVARRIQAKNGIVVSFEPQRIMFSALSGGVVLNDLYNVRLNRMALGATKSGGSIPQIDYSKTQDFGQIKIAASDQSLSWQEICVRQEQVQIISIDDLELERLDFLKLDVEGFEIAALQGAKKTIEKNRPFLWIEYFIAGHENVCNELSYLSDYDFEIICWQNMLAFPKEKK